MADEKPKPEAQSPPQPKKPNIIVTTWKKLGIEPFQILLALKGALPPTIALAAYQGKDFADIYTTLGYLVAILSHLSVAIQPRAKFIQSTLTGVFAVCLAAACALLQIQCAVAARASVGPSQTGSSGSSESTYDASASATCAVFLFLWVFLANVVKCARPQLMLPMIQFSIFVIISSIYGATFPDMTVALSFVRRQLITFLTGFAIATGVSLFILPVTSRDIVDKQMAGMLKLLKGCLASHGAFMKSIKSTDENVGTPEEQAAAAKLKGLIVTTGELLGKLKLELGFARKEFAWGKLNGDQYSELYGMIRQIFQPIMGLSTFLQIMRTTREQREEFLKLPDAGPVMQSIRQLETEEWAPVMQMSQEIYNEFQRNLFLGIQHIALQLEFEKRPKAAKKKSDVEETAGGTPKPGDSTFTDHFAAELRNYQDHRNEVIQDWAENKNITLPTRFWSRQMDQPSLDRKETAVERQKLNQHQLYLILYINHLNYGVGQSVLKLARWADARHEDGTLKKKRFINPGIRHLTKLFQNAFKNDSGSETMTADVNGGTTIYLGDAFKKRKDPEHLPAQNWYEKSTNGLRAIPRFFQSEAAAFGFRAAVATMSLAILAYLRQTQQWFLVNRALWALIMTAISMDPHAGQGIFGFAARIVGTVFAMVASIVIWYMCDHNAAGILVVFWVYMSFWIMMMLKKPEYIMVSMISSVTVILIIGYELQVNVIGRALATSNGQPWYPVYILAPYRLAAVCAGIGAAFFWTYFPYPATTHGALRQDLGSTLYILANFYSCVHTTIDARLRLGPAIHDLPDNHPIRKLDEARQKVFGKVLVMLTRLNGHHKFTKFELPIGGKFPRDTYREMIDSIRNVFTYLSLITYSSSTFITVPEGDDEKEVEEEKRWLADFRSFTADTRVTSHELTTNLCLLSSAIHSGQPLPPYLRPFRPISSGDKMEQINPEIMGIQHYAHPCYAAFAMGEVASAFVTAEMLRLTKLTRELVGEVDFSFHVVSTLDDGTSTSSTLWENGASEMNGRKKKGD